MSSRKRASNSHEADNAIFEPKQIVLGKMKGFSSWPGKVVADEDAPPDVLAGKPKSKRVYLIRFFPAGDYAWFMPREISALSDREIEKYIENNVNKKSNRELLAGYRVAQNVEEWEEALAEQARAAAEAAAAAQDAEEDELDDEDAGVVGSSLNVKLKAQDSIFNGNSKKRRKSAEPKKSLAAGASAKRTKLATPVVPPPAPAPVASDEDSHDPNLSIVKNWRHKLQKAFLGKVPSSESDMVMCAKYFDEIEKFEMQKSYLIKTKLGKVLKRIMTMDDGLIPREAEFQFKKRSAALVEVWHGLVSRGGEGAGESANGGAGSSLGAGKDAGKSTGEGASAGASAAAVAKVEANGAGETHAVGETNGAGAAATPSAAVKPETGAPEAGNSVQSAPASDSKPDEPTAFSPNGEEAKPSDILSSTLPAGETVASN